LKRKGFVHVMEMIVVIVMTIFSLTQFSYLSIPQADWERTKLALLGDDILLTLSKKNINWFDDNAVTSAINKFIENSNIAYSIKLTNVIKENINIGCLCDANDMVGIEEALKPNPLLINSERIRFITHRIDSINGLFNPAYDLVIICHYTDLSSMKTTVMRYLSLDKGIIELFPLERSDIDSVQKDIFGVVWDSASESSSSDDIRFSTYSQRPGTETYTIRKYFLSFPNTAGNKEFSSGASFENFIGGASHIMQKSDNRMKVLLEQSNTKMPAAILNTEISEHNGRTLWLPVGIPDNEKSKNLLKSAVAWAAGDEMYLKQSAMKNPITSSIFKVYNNDMFQIIRIDLILSHL